MVQKIVVDISFNQLGGLCTLCFLEKTQYLNVQATATVTDFAQNFYYLACSICKKATNAYGNEDFWCNYCNKKVPALTPSKQPKHRQITTFHQLQQFTTFRHQQVTDQQLLVYL
ncbi:hypothetical protein RHMOL_Rhmol05G0131300 [Rhododendron molle]|nr:hypothetical protein RHMOL_Rhmol05G0131300 [Rhododendron molle]